MNRFKMRDYLSYSMDDNNKRALEAFSRGDMTALDLRRRLGGASYGDLLSLISAAKLPLPRAPETGREEQIRRARAWMFPNSVA
jgi:hypothetical protein